MKYYELKILCISPNEKRNEKKMIAKEGKLWLNKNKK